jgi:hypothetical protein
MQPLETLFNGQVARASHAPALRDTNKAIIAAGFLDAARQSIVAPAILEEHSGLAPSGAEIARLEGHSSGVTALCLLPDGRLASGATARCRRKQLAQKQMACLGDCIEVSVLPLARGTHSARRSVSGTT